MYQENIRFNTIGDLTVLSRQARAMAEKAKTRTSQCDGMLFTLALGYGSRAEMTRAVRRLVQQAQQQQGRLAVEQIDERLLASHLDTAGMTDGHAPCPQFGRGFL